MGADVVKRLALLGVIAWLCVSCASAPKPTPGEDATTPATRSPTSPAGLYQRGQEAVTRGDYRQALEHFTDLRQRFPNDITVPQALLGSGYAHYKLGDSDAAVEASNAFIQTYDNHPLVDYAYYLRGLARYNDGLVQLADQSNNGQRDHTATARKAFESFSQLVRRFPNSSYSQDSRIRMEVLYTKLADHELLLARQALAQNKAKDAIDRAQYIVTHYARAEAAPEAYAVMIDAFTAQGDLVQAADIRKVLQRKHPAAASDTAIEHPDPSAPPALE